MAERDRPAPSVVVGTAGHIDHGKTTLLRALTGIDADRLPEERRRGMTIDVGYAHLELPDRRVVDFVDVPGHDRLVGNMLVGAGEIDAALLVVAADDGPNAQTLEHLELLDALGIADGLVVITKADLTADADRREALVAEVEALLARTTLAGSPVLLASAQSGEGIDALRGAVGLLAGRTARRARPAEGARLAVDRIFTVKGRGTVVTGSLRGGPIATGATLRLLPAGADVRVREVQVRGTAVEAAAGGRTALLLGAVDAAAVTRGAVLSTDPAVVATSRVLVAMRGPAGLGWRGGEGAPADGDHLRLHVGTDQVDALVVRGPREAIDLPDGTSLAILRLARPIAAASGDRFALRHPSPGSTAGGGVVLDPSPPRGVSRRRLTGERAGILAGAVGSGDPAAVGAARLDLHGALETGGAWSVASDVETALRDAAAALVTAHHATEPASPGLSLPTLRAAIALAARRRVTLGRAPADAVARSVVDGAIADGLLVRDGDRVRDPAHAAGLPPAVLEAMDRLEAALSVPAPPALSAAARDAACPPDGVRALEAANRIVRLEDDLAWSAATHRDLVARAITMAARGPLTPAAFRDETGTSRRYVLVILEDLDRRGLLQAYRRRARPRGEDARPPPGRCGRAHGHADGRATGARRMTVAAIVLAGGGSTRFGTDKLAAELDGRPLLHHAIERVAETADRIVLVLAPGADVPNLPLAMEGRIEIARDDARDQGPLAGVAAGLACLDADADTHDVAIVVGGDMPGLVPAVLRLLADRVSGDGGPSAAVLEGDPVPTLPLALRPTRALAAARMLLAANRRSLRALLEELGAATIPAGEWQLLDPASATLADVDTPEDLARDAKTPVPGRKDGRSA